MAEGRERSEWARASVLLALIANAHRDPKKCRPYGPEDFDPYRVNGEPSEKGRELLREMFNGGAGND